MNLADYLIIGTILLSATVSVLRGFVRETVSLVTWIVAFLLALKFHKDLANWLFLSIKSASLRTVLAFVLIFIIVLLCGFLFNLLVRGFIYNTGLDGMDRFLGFVFGSIRGIILVGVFVLLSSTGASVHSDWWRNSYLIPHFQCVSNLLHNLISS